MDSLQTELEIKQLQREIDQLEREITQREADYEKYSYPVITQGGVYQRGIPEIKDDINKKKAQVQYLKDRIRSIRAAMSREVAKINEERKASGADYLTLEQRAKAIKERRRLNEEKFKLAELRWMGRNPFYKLLHFNKRPAIVKENLDGWTPEEIDSLYKRR